MSRSLKLSFAVQQDQAGWSERTVGNDDSRGRPAGRTDDRKVPMTFVTRTATSVDSTCLMNAQAKAGSTQ